MDASLEQSNQAENDEEYVLLDLENVCLQADIPANAPYTLSGLDTLNPTLTIGNRLKLIGEYEETVGTCILFSHRDEEVRHVASVHKVLKFRLEADVQSIDVS